LDFVSHLPTATLGFNVVLWLAALAVLAPHLRRREAGGYKIHWLVAMLALSGLGALVESVIFGVGVLGSRDAAERLWLQPGVLIAINLFGIAVAAAIIAAVASGRLERESAMFAETAASLQAAEAGYRAIIDGAVDGIYRMTPGGRPTQINHAYAKILGYDSPAECLAGIARSNPYVRPERQAELIAAVVKDGAVYRLESELRRRGGETIWVSESVRAIFDSQAKIGHLEGVAQDISDRRRAREELKIAAAVFEASGNGILVTDRRNVIVAANPAFLEATGYTLDEMIGRAPHMLDAGRHDRAFTRALRRALGTGGTWRGAVWLRHKSGEVQQADLSIVAVRGADGRIDRYIAVYGGRASGELVARDTAADSARDNAHYDALTGLSNRWLFQSRLGQTLLKA
jgi:PAS domain S-box-containing protein